VQDKLDQARLDRAALNQSGVDGIRVLDKAVPPSASASAKKTILTAVGATVALALVILVLGVLILTWIDSTIRRPEEVESILDLRPVGSVPKVS
jgi:capsular polysaccharide biosynthesis protein